jgi:predicted GH43/DUF377 family glycosyl hydrolase
MRRTKILALVIATVILLSLVSIPVLAAGNFVKEPTNPVLVGTNSWESGGVTAGTVLWDPVENIYKMWYSGTDDNGFVRIGYAYSLDGIHNWTESNANPILDVGAGGSWQSNMVGAPYVIRVNAASYKMWFTGADSGNIGQIGYATSTDGILNWIKYVGNPVVPIGIGADFDAAGALNPSVIYDTDDSLYKMWYTGRESDASILGRLRIGYATSADGFTNWIKSGPIMDRDLAGFDDRGVGGTYVIKYSPTNYVMYYTGFETSGLLSEIGRAYSVDGINWVNREQVLTVGDSGSWEEMGVGDPSMLVMGNTLMMWYTGTDNEYLAEIGYASQEEPAPVPGFSMAAILALIGGFTLIIVLFVLFGKGRLQLRRV